MENTVKQCAVWLLNYMNVNGRLQPRRVIKAAAIQAGYTQRDLKWARKILCVRLYTEFAPNPSGTKLEDYWGL